MSSTKDHDLLLGLLIDKLGLVDRACLIKILNDWAGQSERRLDALLLEAGCLSHEQVAWLARAVQRQTERHGDVQIALRTLGAGEVADDWNRCGASRDLTARIAAMATPNPSLQAGENVGAPTSQTARYAIVRHHASGGLGEIFLARDGELHRDVALKEIQPRYANDVDLRARFILEAEITGGLEHPNIVPVHSLGKDDNGRPFYVMRFIRGESLMDAVRRFHSEEAKSKQAGQRTLQQRRLLNCFVDVCNATAFAHSRGVIHRDLKPENVMLGPYGETLLLDWGLAKLVERDVNAVAAQQQGENIVSAVSTLHPAAAGSPAPTRVGSVVGTLAYMSPEQAAGLVDQLSPASDIYGLGAVLYTILTGSAPFTGSFSDHTRQQIIMGHFRPPRQVNPQVPPALDAICRKAMASDPSRRYDTARELADEVEAWLADEPVRAWPEPWRVRAGRWMRRHRTITGAGLAAVLVATISLTVGTLLLARANERERAAKLLAERQEQQARQNFQMARDAVDKYLTRVSEDPRLKAHDLEALRRDLLETAQVFYEQFITQQSDNPDLKAASAWSHYRLAMITAEIGSKKRAAELLRRALDTFSQLVSTYPDSPDYLFGKLETQLNLTRVLSELSLPQEAANVLAAAQTTATELARRDPKNADFRGALAGVHSCGARLCMERNDWPQAEAEYRTAIGLRTELVADKPDAAQQQSLLARDETGLAVLYCKQKRQEEAKPLLFSAADRHGRLVDRHKDVPEYVMDLANACDNLASFYENMTGQPAQVEKARQTALTVRKRLWQSHPEVAQYQFDVAGSYIMLATLYCRTDQEEKGEHAYQTARAMLAHLVEVHPDVPDYRDTLGTVMNNLGNLYRGQGRQEEAVDAIRTAIEIRRKLINEAPGNRDYLLRFGCSCANLGDVLRKEKPGDAIAAYGEAVAVYEKLLHQFPSQAAWISDLNSLYSKIAGIALEQGKLDAALETAEKAVRLLRSRPAAEQNQTEAKAALVLALLSRAEMLAQSGQHIRAAEAAVELQPFCEQDGPALYQLATLWARISVTTAKDPQLDPDRRVHLAKQHETAAVEALNKCLSTGLFKNPLQAQRLQDDAAFQPLRDRDDFKKLIESMGK